MILQAALFLLAASLQQAPESGPTKTSVLPPGCGLTEEQVLELAVPDYSRNAALSKAHEKDELNDYLYEASIVAAKSSNLGVEAGSFLIVLVAIRYGYCDCCHSAQLAVIDVAKARVTWSAPIDGAVGPDWIPASSEHLRFLHLFPDDAPLSLAVTFSTPCAFTGGAIQERWYRPAATSGDGLKLDSVWEGKIEYGYSGNRGGGRREGCAQMRSLWPRRAYEYVVHDLAGWVDTRPGARDPFDVIERPCSNDDRFGAVDFVQSTELTQGQGGPQLVPVSTKLTRCDLRPTMTFPFDLPVRRLFFELPATRAEHTSKDGLWVAAPDRKLVAGFPGAEGPNRETLQIRRLSDSWVLRQVPDPAWLDDRQRPNEYGGYTFRSVGWSRDGSHCLAVIEIGLQFGPVLVSLTPDGKGDAWEGLLPRDQTNLGDGFILDLPQPAKKPAGGSTSTREFSPALKHDPDSP